MFENLVTYHIHRDDAPLMCPGPTPVYRYILAGNGVQVRAETRFFTALLLIAPGVVRGLPPLRPQFRLKVPRLPAGLLQTILTDARGAPRPGGGLNEVLYQFHHHGRTVQLKKPPQQASATANAGHAVKAYFSQEAPCQTSRPAGKRPIPPLLPGGSSARQYVLNNAVTML